MIRHAQKFKSLVTIHQGRVNLFVLQHLLVDRLSHVKKQPKIFGNALGSHDFKPSRLTPPKETKLRTVSICGQTFSNVVCFKGKGKRPNTKNEYWYDQTGHPRKFSAVPANAAG